MRKRVRLVLGTASNANGQTRNAARERGVVPLALSNI